VRIASTATEIADDASGLLFPLFEDGLGREVDVVEVLGGTVAVDGPLGVDEEVEVVLVPMNDPDGPPPPLPVFVFVRLNGMVLLFVPMLHLGAPVESRKHVYPGGQQKSCVGHTSKVGSAH